GEEGDDTFIGSAGNDRYIGGSGEDTADYSAESSGITVNMNDGTVTGSSIGTDTIISVEKIIGASGYSNTFVGSYKNDIFVGGTAADSFTGGQGQDHITTDTGADQIFFLTPYTSDNASDHMDTIADFELGVDKIMI